MEDKQIEVDMREVTAVDAAGRELLAAMHQAGSRVVAEGVEMTALVDEITGKQPSTAAIRPQTKSLPRRPTVPNLERQ